MNNSEPAVDIARSMAVEVSGLKKRYGKVLALDGVDLTVPEGTIFGLVGPNGAGKTTLIKALVGSLRPTAGSVKVLGLDPLREKWELRQQIGYMPQAPALYEDLSARANIFFFSQAQKETDLPNKVDNILNFTELVDRADDPISTFSGGMKKRVSLACALVHKPRIIFLDEPTAAVDPHLRFKMWQLFRELAAQGKTLVISTHLMEEALLCDRVVVMRRGEIIADAPPDRLLEAGRAHITIRQGDKVNRHDIEATPEALAVALEAYGLPDQVDAVEVKSDSLEDVIVNLIQSQGEE